MASTAVPAGESPAGLSVLCPGLVSHPGKVRGRGSTQPVSPGRLVVRRLDLCA